MAIPGPSRKLDPSREMDRRYMYEDPRAFSERFFDGLGRRKVAVPVLVALTIAMTVVPFAVFLCLPVALMVYAVSVDVASKSANMMPMRMPQDADAVDPNDPMPGRKRFHKARGTIFMGNRMDDEAEIWQGFGDAVRHWLIFGTTGSGKAQPEWSKVLTAEGWRPIGTICRDDLLIAPNGRYVRVSDIHPQGQKAIFAVHLADGRVVHATEEHLWMLTCGTVCSTKELARRTRWHSKFIEGGASITSGGVLGGDTALEADPIEVAALLIQPPQEQLARRRFSPAGGRGAGTMAAPDPEPDKLHHESLNPWREALCLARQVSRRNVWDRLGTTSEEATALIDRLNRTARKQLIGALIHHAQDGEGAARIIMAPTDEGARLIRQLFWSSGCPVYAKRTGGGWELAVVCNDFEALVSLDGGEGCVGVPVRSVQRADEEHTCVCLELADTEGLYITDGYVATHNTNTLISVSLANALAMSSGLFYSDAKAAPDLAYRVASMARYMGRDDDVFFLNYITGAMKPREGQRVRMTNTSNPFESGPADSKVQVMSGLMPQTEGDNAIFQQRAVALLNAMMYPLVDLRNEGYINLGVNEIRKALNFSTLLKFLTTDHLPITPKSKYILRSYLDSLPGIDTKSLKEYRDGTKQIPQEASRQFGFAQMYFTRAISALADTYGHIYWVNMGEIDFVDCVLNRRITVIMLPALEKSLEELGNLGKINLSSLRDAMKVGLGSGIEGKREQILDAVPTRSKVPVVIVLDEVAYQLVEGFAVTAAQARGLNIQVIFAGQDYAGIKKASEAEAQQIVENTNTKVFMKVESHSETFEMLQKIADKADVAVSTGGQQHGAAGLPSRVSKMEYAHTEKDRVVIGDLRKLIEGEAYITFGDKLIQAKMANADMGEMPDLRINRYLRIRAPLDHTLPAEQRIIKTIRVWAAARTHGDTADEAKVPPTLEGLLAFRERAVASGVNPMEATMAMIAKNAGLLGEDEPGEVTNDDDLLFEDAANTDPMGGRPKSVLPGMVDIEVHDDRGGEERRAPAGMPGHRHSERMSREIDEAVNGVRGRDDETWLGEGESRSEGDEETFSPAARISNDREADFAAKDDALKRVMEQNMNQPMAAQSDIAIDMIDVARDYPPPPYPSSTPPEVHRSRMGQSVKNIFSDPRGEEDGGGDSTGHER